MCQEAGLTFLPTDTVGRLQLIMRQHHQMLAQAAPTGDEAVTFGKHLGKSFDEAWQEDKNYVNWMIGE
eukprot:11754830-Alexandrium_andersonii.AAC.1